MVPMYRCLWIGPEGGTWNNSGGDPNAVWEAYELTWTDPECYLIDWVPMENPIYTWPDILSMAEFRDNAVVFVNEPPLSAIQGLVIRDANLTVNSDLTVVGDGQDDGFMAVCVGQGADGILNINDGILTCGSTDGPLEGQTGPVLNNYGGSRFMVGRAINATDSAVGIVNQYGGTVRVANHLQIADIGYGEARELLGGYAGWGNLSTEQRQAIAATSAGSTYNLYDGVIEVVNNIEVGKANGSYGIFNVYGGQVNVSGMLRSYYTGEMTIDGGTVNVTGNLVWPYRSSHGVLTLKKGSLSFKDAVICEDGTGISEVNVLGGSFDCRGNWGTNGSGGTGENQQTIRIDCGNVENVHFGSLDAALDTNDLLDLVLVVPKDTEPNNAATKVWIDGNVTFNGWAAIRIDVNKDFAGQVGDTWELVNIGGSVIGMEQVLILNDSPKYIFSVDLKERQENSVLRKIITAELILINPDPPVSFSMEEPTPDADDIYNFVGSTLDSENVGGNDDSNTYVAHDRGAQGQTFLTGDNEAGYVMTGFWVRHVAYVDNPSNQSTWYQMPAGSELGIRVTDPAASGTDAFVLASQTYIITGEEPDVLPAETTNTNNGTGTWIHITLDAPVTLAANTLYGFDLVSIRSNINLFFETAGIDDSAPGGNPYPDGAAYTSGASGAANNVLNPEPGDRVFLVELDAI